MNIFILDKDPVKAAQFQCDKHVVKMIVESAQMLSTTHRICDGVKTKRQSKSGKRLIEYWEYPDPFLEELFYKVVHKNHPCTQWSMENSANYRWHFEHWVALCEEYTHRYGKVHATCAKLHDVLRELPKNITHSETKTPFRLAMNSNTECIFPDDPVKSYRLFYQTKQDRFKMTWRNRDIPTWFQKMC